MKLLLDTHALLWFLGDDPNLSSTTVKHRDPFDRLLVAQAIVDDLTIVTRVPEIQKYSSKHLW
ncbi:MAG: type II toxin-antitoxin system VapC family toxin [Limisphaerales bacterium]